MSEAVRPGSRARRQIRDRAIMIAVAFPRSSARGSARRKPAGRPRRPENREAAAMFGLTPAKAPRLSTASLPTPPCRTRLVTPDDRRMRVDRFLRGALPGSVASHPQHHPQGDSCCERKARQAKDRPRGRRSAPCAFRRSSFNEERPRAQGVKQDGKTAHFLLSNHAA